MLDFSLPSSFLVSIQKNPGVKYLIYPNSLVANLDVQSVYFLCQELNGCYTLPDPSINMPN